MPVTRTSGLGPSSERERSTWLVADVRGGRALPIEGGHRKMARLGTTLVDHRDSSRHITVAADLRGRTDECALLDTLVDAVRLGEAPLLDRLDRLPTPQR